MYYIIYNTRDLLNNLFFGGIYQNMFRFNNVIGNCYKKIVFTISYFIFIKLQHKIVIIVPVLYFTCLVYTCTKNCMHI